MKIRGLKYQSTKSASTEKTPEDNPSGAKDRLSDADTDLQKLSRLQILQLLRDAMAENDRLRAQVDDLTCQLEAAQKQLRDRRIELDDSESLAEASLRLSGVFIAAQHAIDLYQYNLDLRRKGGSEADAAPSQAPDASSENGEVDG